MAVATNLQLHEQTDLERSCTFSLAVSEGLSVSTLQLFPVQSVASFSDRSRSWLISTLPVKSHVIVTWGWQNEGLEKGEILKRYFSVFVLDWKNSAVKTSMTKHETATTTNEVCLVNSVLDEAAWNAAISCPLIREFDKLLVWGF